MFFQQVINREYCNKCYKNYIIEENKREKEILEKVRFSKFVEKVKNIDIKLVPRKNILNYCKDKEFKLPVVFSTFNNKYFNQQKIKNRWYFNETAVKLFFEEKLNENYFFKI